MLRHDVVALSSDHWVLLNLDLDPQMPALSLSLVHGAVPFVLELYCLVCFSKLWHFDSLIECLSHYTSPLAWPITLNQDLVLLAWVDCQRAMTSTGVALLLFLEQWVSFHALALARVARAALRACSLSSPET